MKNLIALSFALSFLPTAAFSADGPNFISCTDAANNVELNYATSSRNGQPQFNLRIDGEQVFPPTRGFSGRVVTELKSEPTVLGELVSALDSSMTPVDAPTYVYSFFVPTIAVVPGRDATFESMLLKGSTGGFIPDWVPMQRVGQATAISCKGQVVAF